MSLIRIPALAVAVAVTATFVGVLPAPPGGALASSTGAGLTSSAGRALVPGPEQFTAPMQNPYFPLRAGLVLRYRGTEDDEQFRERLAVTHATKLILGVRTRVIHDVLRRADGTLAERTTDWYAADNDGNVWYFGERTATYDARGRLDSREGSWQAGVHGARAGLIMPASPKPTDAYRQEFRRGHAEDQAWIVARHGGVTVPAKRFHDVVRSYEWTRLEPGVVSLKLYAPGVGIVREKDVAGGTEIFELVAIRHR